MSDVGLLNEPLITFFNSFIPWEYIGFGTGCRLLFLRLPSADICKEIINRNESINNLNSYTLNKSTMKTETISARQIELKNLIRKRKDIVENISKMSKRKKFLNRNTSDRAITSEGQPRKLVKKQDTPSNNNKDDGTSKEPKKHIHHSNGLKEQQETQQAKKMRQQLLKRNRRIFGGLTSHLKKAQSNMEAQKPKIEQKNKILEQIQKKQKQKSEELVQEEMNRLDTELRKAEAEKQSNSKQILRIQNQILLQSYSQYSSHLQSFLFTETQPSIAWKPAKQFQAAKSLLGDKQKQFQKKRKQVEQLITEYEQKFDYCSYMAENEREYYKNMVHNYYRTFGQHFFTKTEPNIFWKPAKPYSNLESLIPASKETLQKIGSVYEEKCDKFYLQQMERMERGKVRMREREEDHEQQESSNSAFAFNKQQSS